MDGLDRMFLMVAGGIMFCMSDQAAVTSGKLCLAADGIRTHTDEEDLLLGFNEALHSVRSDLLLSTPWRAVYFEDRPALEAAA